MKHLSLELLPLLPQGSEIKFAFGLTVGLAIMLCVRVPLALRNVDDLLRDVEISHRAVRFC